MSHTSQDEKLIDRLLQLSVTDMLAHDLEANNIILLINSDIGKPNFEDVRELGIINHDIDFENCPREGGYLYLHISAHQFARYEFLNDLMVWQDRPDVMRMMCQIVIEDGFEANEITIDEKNAKNTTLSSPNYQRDIALKILGLWPKEELNIGNNKLEYTATAEQLRSLHAYKWRSLLKDKALLPLDQRAMQTIRETRSIETNKTIKRTAAAVACAPYLAVLMAIGAIDTRMKRWGRRPWNSYPSFRR